MRKVLENTDEMNARIYRFPTSAIKFHGKKINYHEFLCNTEYRECGEALKRIMPKISMEKIQVLIDQLPYISELQRIFYKAYIGARYEKLLLPAYKILS